MSDPATWRPFQSILVARNPGPGINKPLSWPQLEADRERESERESLEGKKKEHPYLSIWANAIAAEGWKAGIPFQNEIDCGEIRMGRNDRGADREKRTDAETWPVILCVFAYVAVASNASRKWGIGRYNEKLLYSLGWRGYTLKFKGSADLLTALNPLSSTSIFTHCLTLTMSK